MITLQSNHPPFPRGAPYLGHVPAGHGTDTAAARTGQRLGAAGASSVHSATQQVTELQAVAAQAGSAGSAAGSSQGYRQQPTQGGEAREALGPCHVPGTLQLPRPLTGADGPEGDGVCTKGCVHPNAAPAKSCSSADSPGACAWREVSQDWAQSNLFR